jgi:hypothetical protein
LTVHIFVGPTMTRQEVEEILPGAVVHPPIKHLDLLSLDLKKGDRVAIIDGVFVQAACVRHKELMWILQQGIPVAGSSGMGALRAAELAPYGMRGVGQVFQAISSGRVDCDDEIAIAQAPAELDWRPLSDALVNIRVAAERAAAAGVIDPLDGHAVIETARKTFFPHRKLSQIIEQCVYDGSIPKDRGERFLQWISENSWDAKKEDAQLLLSLLARQAWAVRPPEQSDRVVREFTPNVYQWIAEAKKEDVEGVKVSQQQARHVLQLFAPDVHRMIESWGLAVLAGRTLDWHWSQLDELRPAAARVCADRGLIGASGITRDCQRKYLDPRELDCLDEGARQLLTAARIVAAERIHGMPIATPSDAYRIGAEALSFNAELIQRGDKYRPSHIAARTVDRWFNGLWSAEDVGIEARRRGFADIDAFRRAGRVLLPYASAKGIRIMACKGGRVGP